MGKGGEKVLNMDSVYREYGEFVFRYLYSLCREEHLAEELMQETFYQAVRSAKRYDGSCKVSTWLCQIAKHLWYQEADRRKRKGTFPLDEEKLSEDPSMDEKAIWKEDIIRIFQQVHKLDEVSKEVFFLRITGNLSFREIGEVMGKNENWARVTYYRAKQKAVKGWDDE